MSVKLTLLKSGETLISDVKEVVSDVNQDKPTAFLLENPHIVDTKKKGNEGQIDVVLTPWIMLSKDILGRIPDLPKVMDNANTTLQMIAEGKLNLNALNGKNFEVEELKLKNLRNNMIIVFLGIVIAVFIVF